MLQITIPPLTEDYWDEEREEFVYVPIGKEQKLQLEHSLVALSKWESKWCKPFMTNAKKTPEETIDYIKCMTINAEDVDSDVYSRLTNSNISEVMEYIHAPMTATKISKKAGKGGCGVQITSELIYYWMITLGIPVEFEKWHLNRLITLIQLCDEKNTPPKKMSRREILEKNSTINAARRKKLNSKG